MRTAAALLTSSRSSASLAEVLRAAALGGEPVELDSKTRDALGLDDVKHAQLAAGNGLLRVLLFEPSPEIPLREAFQRVARRVAARAPHVLWLAAAIDRAGVNAGIVCWTNDVRSRRVASFMWEPMNVVDSDAETLCALAAVREDEDVLFHARCMEVLGREALTRRFYRLLEAQVDALARSLPSRVAADDARDFALLYASRLLFLRFVEAKGWMDGNRVFIGARFDECMRTGGGFHRRVLLPLFFGTLNTPVSRRAPVARSFGRVPFLNGGLFARTALERRVGGCRFPDERLGALLDQVFNRFRFIAREDSASWSEASVDPEMLGRAFESLMASSERRAGGVFYTPNKLVARVADHAIDAALDRKHRGADDPLHAARDLCVLDPACGSGAFLVYVLERLAELRIRLGDRESVASVRRDVLARSVFGVDRSATAVWLCELRLWLSVVVESHEDDPLRVSPLPNLDRNIRVGDTLLGAAFDGAPGVLVGNRRMMDLRRRYLRATGARKQNVARALDREERRRARAEVDRAIEIAHFKRKEMLAAQRVRDLFGQRMGTASDAKRELKRLRDTLRRLRKERRRIQDGGAAGFSFGACFADAQARGGFDVVIGNPPWVRLHRIPATLRAIFKETYDVYRDAQWHAGAATARAAPGFASQVDLAALFAERSIKLLRDRGVVSLLLPAKLWRSLAGGGLRRFLAARTQLLRLEDLTDSKHAFDAAVYPSLLVARAQSPAFEAAAIVVHGAPEAEWAADPGELPYDNSPGAPWLMLSRGARRAFDRIRAAGAPLGASHFGAPRLGVKSGCNAAFVVRVLDVAHDVARIVDADGEEGSVEAALLRPALRGEKVSPWRRADCDEWILWTHDERGIPLARLPDRARAWLRRRYGELAGRSDAARSRRWWSLFRVDAADSNRTRVVWADFGRRPRALVLSAGDPTVPLNTCYVLRCADDCDAWALAALLNSSLAEKWLNVIAEPARGGYRRYMGWTVGQLPIPMDWSSVRDSLSSTARELQQNPALHERLLASVLHAYHLRRADVAALFEWSA